MKKLLLLAGILLCMNVSAQLNITTNYRQDAIWDELNEKWDVLASNEDVTFFEFNSGLTLFTHTTNTIKSTYIIKEFEYDEELSKYTMIVVSDVGNEYEMIVDAINNYVGFFYFDEDDVYILVRHTIKKIWFNEK